MRRLNSLRAAAETGVIAAIAACLIGRGAHAGGPTIFVSPCGNDAWTGFSNTCLAPNGPKRTIQGAVNFAGDTWTILVLPGTYLGPVDMQGKALSLIGSGGAAATFIDGEDRTRGIVCDSLEGADTVINGFTITNCRSDGASGAGLFCLLSSPTIVSCVFDGNLSELDGGGALAFGSAASFTNCDFINNTALDRGAGLLCFAGSVTIEDCLFDNNWTFGDPGGGLANLNNAATEVTNTTFSDNHVPIGGAGLGGCVHNDASNPTFTSCTFDFGTAINGGGAVSCVNGSDVQFGACGFTDCVVFDGFGGALYVAEKSTAALTLCGFQNNEVELGLGGAITVDDSTITIAACTFTENIASAAGGALHLRQFTDATISNSTLSGNECGSVGGAIYCAGQVSLTLEECTLQNNVAGDNGGGVMMAAASTANVEDCVFLNNSSFNGGGLYAFQNTTLRLTGSTFTNNHAENVGGGISELGSIVVFDAFVADCGFFDNTAGGSGGGIGTGLDSHLHVVRCQFDGNSADNTGGGAASLGGGNASLFANCIFSDNTAAHGSAISGTTGSNSTHVNCLLFSNTAPAGEGAVYVDDNNGRITLRNCTVADNLGGAARIDELDTPQNTLFANCIFWNNGGSITGPAPRVVFSDVQGGFAGPGNININPNFINAPAANYRINAASPCVDAGHSLAAGIDGADLDADDDTGEFTPVDLDDAARFQNAAAADTGCAPPGVIRVDLGAYERAGALGGVQPAAAADLNGDGSVGPADLAALLASWGPCANACCLADLNFDGVVGPADLAQLLASWT